MSRPWYKLAVALLLAGSALSLWLRAPRSDSSRVNASLKAGLSLPAVGFARAEAPRQLSFPADQGPHPDFQTEWWYVTGNLADPDGQRYGYQLTFFRRALAPPDLVPTRESAWAASQVYMAHFAFTDASRDAFQSYERLQRGSAGLAGAQAEPAFAVWLEDWSIRTQSDGSLRLQARQGELSLDLVLNSRKPPLLQGEDGYSRKGSEPGNASYYYSLTRLETSGQVALDKDVSFAAAGLSWLDHEWSTSALSHGQIGWDWFALQLSDGRDLTVFNIRQADGSPDAWSSGSLSGPDGAKTTLGRDDFMISALGTWQSPHSGGRYPAAWQVEVPSAGLSLRVIPLVKDQENQLSFTYWEGAVRVEGTSAGQPLTGFGYVELTGYAASMEGDF